MLLAATRAVVLVSWIAMLAILTARHLRIRARETTRERTSRVGLLLQALAYAGVFGVHPHTRALLEQWIVPAGAAVLAMCMAIGGAAIVVWCQHVLGVQWSLTARLVDGHRLVTSGPYAYVRHPIYAAMIPMLAATAVAFSSPAVLAVSLVLYVVGTRIRIASEERLMASAFGAEWNAYRDGVAALIPFL